jgi:hypothetical protein
MSTLVFWGNITVFAGVKQYKNGSWKTHSKKTLTEIIRKSLLEAKRDGYDTKVPFILKDIDLTNYDKKEFTYYVKCLVEVDENVYNIKNASFQDLSDFYLPGIPTFDFQVNDNYDLSCEMYLDL